MLYIGKELIYIYNELRTVYDENTQITIYAINYIDSKINEVDFSKVINDLKYLYLPEAHFFVVAIDEQRELKNFTDLKEEQLKTIFFDIVPENQFSLYSNDISKEKYNSIIKKLRIQYDEEHFKLYHFFYYFDILYKHKNRKKININGNKYTVKELTDFIKKQFQFQEIKNIIEKKDLKNLKEFFKEINDFFEKDTISLLDENKLQSFLNDKENLKIKFICDMDIKKLNDFLVMYNFICKPHENITEKNINEILKIDIDIKTENLGLDIEGYSQIKFSFEDKYQILLISIFEKIYKYYRTNNYNATDVYVKLEKLKEEFVKNKLKTNFIKELKKTILKSTKKKDITTREYDSDKIIEKYLREFQKVFKKKNISDEELKYFSFNSFFRNQLYYKKIFLDKIKKSDVKGAVTNLSGILRGEREIGEENLKKIITFLKLQNKSILIPDIKTSYALLQKYKLLNSIVGNIETKNDLMKYIDIYDFFKEKDFMLRCFEKSTTIILNRIVLEFSYYPNKINKLYKYEYYIVEYKKNKEIMQYLGESDEKICFSQNDKIKILNKEEIEIYQIKSLVFSDDTKEIIQPLF